jgi:hypothetical protein
VTGASARPHPGEQSVLVVFVVGGISYLELAQVQRVLDQQIASAEAAGPAWSRVVVVSTDTLGPADVLKLALSSNS